METRTALILATREANLGLILENSSTEESFQNQTLRPILKFQNEIIVEIFAHYIAEYKGNFHQFKIEKRLKFIEDSLQKDQKLKNLYKGIVVGQFTLEELRQYHQNKSSYNRRIYQLIIERLKSQIILFDIQVNI